MLLVCFFPLLLILDLFSYNISVLAADEFGVISDEFGHYSVRVGNETWLNSAPTFFRANKKAYSSADGSLKLLNAPVAIHGVDTLGPWHGSVFNYSLDGSSVMANIRIYEKYSAAVFTQVGDDCLFYIIDLEIFRLMDFIVYLEVRLGQMTTGK